jgi:hypothetical protein
VSPHDRPRPMEADEPRNWSWWLAAADRQDVDRFDLWLQALQAGQADPALFHEPPARHRVYEPVRRLTPPTRQRPPGRAVRHQQLMLTLLVIALIAGGLARLSWLVTEQASHRPGHSQIQTDTRTQRPPQQSGL